MPRVEARDGQGRLDAYFELLARHPSLARNDGAALRIVLDRGELERFERETGEVLGVLAEDAYLIFLHDLIEGEAGRRFVYGRLVNTKNLLCGPGVVILAVERRAAEPDAIVLIRTYRHALRSWVLELPRGAAEPGVEAIDNVRRELAEETGLEALSIELLGTVEPDSGFMTSRAGVYFALVAPGQAGAPSPQAGEAIEGVVRLTPAEVRDHVADGRIEDAFVASAIGLALLRGKLRMDP